VGLSNDANTSSKFDGMGLWCCWGGTEVNSGGASNPKSEKSSLPGIAVRGFAGVTGVESNVVSNSPNASLRVEILKASSTLSSSGAASWSPEKSNAPNV
jgi:hypothetical protein